MPAPKSKPAAKKAAKKKASAAAPDRAAAAMSEVAENPDAKTFEFRGVTLTLPDKLPGTVYFDLADADDSIAGQIRLLESFIGTDGVRTVRQAIADQDVPLDEMSEVIGGLFEQSLAAYGLDAGESAASDGS